MRFPSVTATFFLFFFFGEISFSNEAPGGHWANVRKVPSNVVERTCVPNAAGASYAPQDLCMLRPATRAEIEIPYATQNNSEAIVIPVEIKASKPLPNVKPSVVPPTPRPLWERPGTTELGAKFTGTMDYAALRKVALASGVPALVYDRALANFRDLQIKNKTSRGCFLASDLTGIQGKTWMMCFNPKPHVETMDTAAGGGDGKDCVGDFKNRTGCPRFWSNKPNSCLSTGGNLMTGPGRYYNETKGRYFIPLVGLDAGVNSNTSERQIGIHVAADTDGNPSEGKTDPRALSRGNYVIPFQTPRARLTDMSSTAEGGALALYSYPSKSDLDQFKNGGRPEYWNEECRNLVSYAAWIDQNDSGKILNEAFENSQGDFVRFMLNNPEAQDVPAEELAPADR